MARLMMHQTGGEPTLLATGSRGSVAEYSLELMTHNTRKMDKRAAVVRGCPAEWALISLKRNRVVAQVWVESSAQAIANAPIPDFCRAPEGAPA